MTQPEPLTEQQLDEYAQLIARTTPLGAAVASPGMGAALLADLRRARDRVAELDALPDRLEAALTGRYTALGNPFSRMDVHKQGPDGWPMSTPVSPNDVAGVVRELLTAPAPPVAPLTASQPSEAPVEGETAAEAPTGRVGDPLPAVGVTGTQPCGHDDYHDRHPWHDRPHVWCPGNSYADDQAATEETRMTDTTARYRHRSPEVEAVQWTGSNADALRAFCGPDFDEIELDDRTEDPDQTAAVREADHGTWRGLAPGDWVVRLDGGLYEFSAADFAKQYEPADRSGLRERIAVVATPFLANFSDQEAAKVNARELAATVLSVLPPAADRAAVLTEAADELGRMDYDTDSNDYGYDTYRDAWNGGVMDGAEVLRRLADETVHACPPDGSGLTACCRRTPFELPPTDRMSSDPAAVTCAAPADGQTDEEAGRG